MTTKQKESLENVRFKKGDSFVNTSQLPLLFMEINEVEESTEYMDHCLVTWYGLGETGPIIQRLFPMAARDGKFWDFKPISRQILKEVKQALQQFETEVKNLSDQKKIKALYNEYDCKLRNLAPELVSQLETKQKIKSEVVINRWLTCSEDKCWAEDNPELKEKYVTIVCTTSESYDNKNDKTIISPFIYFRGNCPYCWSELVRYGAKYMMIEKPRI